MGSSPPFPGVRCTCLLCHTCPSASGFSPEVPRADGMDAPGWMHSSSSTQKSQNPRGLRAGCPRMFSPKGYQQLCVGDLACTLWGTW